MWPHAFPLLSWTLLSCLPIELAIATPNPLPVGPPHCDKDYYGSPKIEDCKQAIFWIPKSGPNAVANHVFAEPQLLNPPFKALKNPNAPKAIIQLPKIFKYGSCNIAIVVQPYGYEKRLKPEFTYTWSNIANQVLRLKTCLEPPRTVADRKPQGGYKPLVITQSRPAGIYMYTTNSRFNYEVMTEYMVTGKAITPPNVPNLLGHSLGNGSLSGLSLNPSNASNNTSSTPSLDLLSVF